MNLMGWESMEETWGLCCHILECRTPTTSRVTTRVNDIEAQTASCEWVVRCRIFESKVVLFLIASFMVFACSRNEFVLLESSHEQSDGDAEEVILGGFSFSIGVGGGAMFRSSIGSAASLETRTR